MGRSALAVLERGLAQSDFLLGESYSVADIGLYAYTHVAPELGLELTEPTQCRRGSAASRRRRAS